MKKLSAVTEEEYEVFEDAVYALTDNYEERAEIIAFVLGNKVALYTLLDKLLKE